MLTPQTEMGLKQNSMKKQIFVKKKKEANEEDHILH